MKMKITERCGDEDAQGQGKSNTLWQEYDGPINHKFAMPPDGDADQ
jgi:hypothetical protein